MLRIYASALANLVDRFGDFRKADDRSETLAAAKRRLTIGETGVGLPLYKLFHAHASIVSEWAKEIPLTSARKQLRHMEWLDELGGLKEAQLFDEIEQLNRRLREDLEAMQFYYVRPELEPFYDAKEAFGEKVAESFRSANDDIAEAGNCVALGRSTACVMHLMRVLEVGLMSLARAVNADADRPGWEKVINSVRGKINDMNAQSHGATWRELKDLYSEAAAHLLVAKDAWRNHVMHKPVHYEEKKAKEIYSGVCMFMQTIAPVLSEP